VSIHISHGMSERLSATKPSLWFTCGMMHRYSRYNHDFILDACREIMDELAAHRNKAMCHCDLSYIVTGETRQKTTRLCSNPEAVHASVRNAISLHDRICCCGCFNATRYLGKKHLVGRSCLRTKVVLQGLTGGDMLCICCLTYVVVFICIFGPLRVWLSDPST
jgi:hypothetical protein